MSENADCCNDTDFNMKILAHINGKVFSELVNGILQALPEKVLRIILYGSVARGTEKEDSDVDIAVFVSEKLDYTMEDRLSDIVVDMNLKYNKVFSVIDIDEAVYRKWRHVTFYQNVDKEGIVLWTKRSICAESRTRVKYRMMPQSEG